MKLLALDTSVTRTGWCRGNLEGPIACGSFSPRVSSASDIGAMLCRFRNWLEAEHYDVDEIVFEKPVRPNNKLNLLGARKIYGLTNTVEMFAYERSIPVFECDNQKTKKLAYGKGGKKPKGTTGLIQKWGMFPKNADEADACAVFLYHVSQRHPQAFEFWRQLRVEQ